MQGDENEKAVTRRLLLAKGLLARGSRSVAAGDPLGRVVALVELAAAIETTVRAIATKFELDVDAERDPGLVAWLKLIQKSEEIKKQGLKIPQEEGIRRINSRRNATLHHAETLDQETLDEYVRITRSFIEEAFLRFFGVKVDELTELEHIADPQLKELISIARAMCAAGGGTSVQVSLSLLRLAVDLAAKSCLPDADSTTLVAAGVNPLDYSRFCSLAQVPMVSGNGRLQIYIKRLLASPDEYTWAEAFVLELLLEWQARGYQPILGSGDVLPFAKDLLDKHLASKAPP